jgi:hypothetical protein
MAEEVRARAGCLGVMRAPSFVVGSLFNKLGPSSIPIYISTILSPSVSEGGRGCTICYLSDLPYVQVVDLIDLHAQSEHPINNVACDPGEPLLDTCHELLLVSFQ